MKIHMIKWHRRMALLAFIGVMIWGLSGLLHPLMTWTNPRPINFMPPAATSFVVPDAPFMRRVLQQYAPAGVIGLRVMGDGVQITLPDRPERLYIGRDGAVIAEGDRDHAVRVARHYTGLREAPVADARLITAFSNQYTYINRYLPVWQVTFADGRGISVYVDTATDRLGAMTDRRKVILQTLFQVLHTGQWLDAAEPLRLMMIALMVGLVLSVSVAGFYMLVRLRPGNKHGRPQGLRPGVRTMHRLIAYAALLPLLMFPLSGLFHLFVHSPLAYPEAVPAPIIISAQDFKYWPQGRADDLRLVQPGWWRAQNGAHVTYTRLADGHVIKGDEAFVRMLFAGTDAPLHLVTSFNDEYGFAYKRLPVWRVNLGDELLFIEAKTGVVAARVSTIKQAETWVFSRLHKWQFLDGMSAKIGGTGPFKTAFRDAVMVVFVILALGAALLGLLLRRRAPRPM